PPRHAPEDRAFRKISGRNWPPQGNRRVRMNPTRTRVEKDSNARRSKIPDLPRKRTMLQRSLRPARRPLAGMLLGTAGLISCLLPWNRPSAGADDAPAKRDDFRTRVAPFLQQHCVKCHGPDVQKGKLTLHAMDGDVSSGKDKAKWKAVAERLALN